MVDGAVFGRRLQFWIGRFRRGVNTVAQTRVLLRLLDLSLMIVFTTCNYLPYIPFLMCFTNIVYIRYCIIFALIYHVVITTIFTYYVVSVRHNKVQKVKCHCDIQCTCNLAK